MAPGDWERTSLKPYVDLLDKHVLLLMEEVRKEKRKTGNPRPTYFLIDMLTINRYLVVTANPQTA